MTSESIARALAPLLPDGPWRVELPPVDDDFQRRLDPWADLVRNDGARIRLRVGGWRLEGRVTFYGCWPKTADGRDYAGARVSITVSEKRKPEAMAGDIARRFLPAYLVEYARCAKLAAAHDANRAEACVIAQRIAGAIGARAELEAKWNRDGVPILHEPDCVSRLTVEPAYEGIGYSRPASVSFEVRGLDPAVAAEVLDIIARHEQAAAGPRVATATRVANDTGVMHHATPVEFELEDSDEHRKRACERAKGD